MTVSNNMKPMTSEQREFFNSLTKDREESANVLGKTSMGGVEKTVIDKYSEKAHFIYELLQNADDTKATKVRFVLNNDGLIFAHNGTIHFSISDSNSEKEEQDKKIGKLGHINSITSIGSTTKFKSEIGKFGVGFKSVFLYTNTPHIYDPPFMFKIERLIVPRLLEKDHPARMDDETLFHFIFDLNNAEMKPDMVYEEIDNRIQNLDNPLLFLRNLEKIEWVNKEGHIGVYSKQVECNDTHRIVSLTNEVNDKSSKNKYLIFDKKINVDSELKVNIGVYSKQVECNDTHRIVSLTNEVNDKSSKNKYLIFDKKINVDSELKVNIAFKFVSNENKISSDSKFPAYCFFKTKESTGLKFIVNAPFLLTDNREGVKEGDEWNKYLIETIADLIVDHLVDIKDLGLLNIDFFNVIPISKSDFWDTQFIPVYNKVLNKLKSDEELLPANNGGYISSKSAILGRATNLIDLLDCEQLSMLFEIMNAKWLDSNITQDRSPELRKYLIEELDIPEITPEKFANQFTKDFIEKQTDDWIIKFYMYLKIQRSWWRGSAHLNQGPLCNKPFIRLETDIHVAPFNGSGKPLAYLSVNSGSSFPIVKRAIINDAQARDFLTSVGLTEPDKIAEVIEIILPKYSKTECITIEENVNDVEKIVSALKAASEATKEDLISKLKNIKFLARIVPESQDICLCSPENLYITKPYIENNDTDDFFDMNPNIYFVCGKYNISKELLLKMGCSDKIRVKYSGHCDPRRSWNSVAIHDSRGYHIRGLDGFDPNCEIDGLKYALENITIKRAQIIWDILKKYNHIIYGSVEVSTRQDYIGSSIKEQASVAGKLLREKAWLPDKNGDFDKPSNLFLSDLHDGFDQDNTEAKRIIDKLEFRKENRGILDIYPDIPDDLKTKFNFANSLTDEEMKMIENKRHSDEADSENVQDFNYINELTDVFNHPQTKSPEDPTPPPGHIPDIGGRIIKTDEEIKDSIKNESDPTERVTRVLAKKWDQKNEIVRTFLEYQYKGKCQICEYAFDKRNGDKYFEGVYLLSRTKAAWIDRIGNVLCLCANCCAKFQYGSVEADDIVSQINNIQLSNEDGLNNRRIKFKLCGESTELKFSDKHILDLQGIMNANL